MRLMKLDCGAMQKQTNGHGLNGREILVSLVLLVLGTAILFTANRFGASDGVLWVISGTYGFVMIAIMKAFHRLNSN